MSPNRRHRAGPFRVVLCPVDFSRHARAALRYAARIADRAGGGLSVLYVSDPFLVAAAAAAYDEKALAAQSADELAGFIRRTIGIRAGGQRIGASVVLGQPAEAIQKAARTQRADIIVVGSEGLSGAARLFFGSTTSRLLAHATVPVLAVPPGGTGVPRGWPGSRIVAAIDLGRDALRDVKAAADLARWFGSELALVHVVERTRTPGWLSLNRAAHDRDRVQRARERLVKLARGVGGVALVQTHVFMGDPAARIADLARDLEAGLVVLTLRGSDRVFGDRKGATTYRVVCQANTPVLAIPAGWTFSGA